MHPPGRGDDDDPQTSDGDPALARAASRAKAAITIDDVTVTYSIPGHSLRTVLAGINLTIPAREFIVLVGRSGWGKTTLLNRVAGLVEPSDGSVMVVGGEPRAARRHLGFMPARAPRCRGARHNATLNTALSCGTSPRRDATRSPSTG